ncbi:low molecular weight protein arginine phosphatase [Halobacillus sp. Marseille-Q1614]|uniref:low molecular weight protein arginine phosphatase n=1 Tax=Halobacillus sp. Marseille-Q1614 TaxID=2709134 RepID=UPI00156FFB47|nr:low molecular weight protein arginine phosphatase [Halobacillus sp. Marseille-Q1614]
MNILFVCTGNTCRSPMAEALMKAKEHDAEIKSAGIFAGANQPIATNAAEVLKELGLTFDNTSTQVDEELLEWADVVLSMTESHKQTLALQYPEFEDKFFTLKEYVYIKEDQWRHLTDLYALLEEKRAWILSQVEEDLSEAELEEHLLKELADEIDAIRKAEQELPNLNIVDPYGQNKDVYRRTRDELDETINALVKKLSSKNK